MKQLCQECPHDNDAWAPFCGESPPEEPWYSENMSLIKVMVHELKTVSDRRRSAMFDTLQMTLLSRIRESRQQLQSHREELEMDRAHSESAAAGKSSTHVQLDTGSLLVTKAKAQAAWTPGSKTTAIVVRSPGALPGPVLPVAAPPSVPAAKAIGARRTVDIAKAAGIARPIGPKEPSYPPPTALQRPALP